MSNIDRNPTPDMAPENDPQAPQDIPEAAEPSMATPEAPDTPQDAPEGNKANREAAKYRTQLRAAEADRDNAQATAARLRAAILDNALTAHGITPVAYRAVTADPEAVVDEDGTVDAETLAANARAARDALGIHVPRPSSPALAEYTGATSLSNSRGWGAVLND